MFSYKAKVKNKMGFELDTLKNHDACICLNNTTGRTFSFYSLKMLIEGIKEHTDRPIQDFFEYEELLSYFNDNFTNRDTFEEEIKELEELYK